MYLIYWLDPQHVSVCVLDLLSGQHPRGVHGARGDFRPDISILSCHPQPRARVNSSDLRWPWALLHLADDPVVRSQKHALLDFALRASVTKAIILVVLFYVARHYGSQLGKNVGGLMLGFSIYVAINIAMMASAKVFGPALYAKSFGLWNPLPLCYVYWCGPYPFGNLRRCPAWVQFRRPRREIPKLWLLN